MKLTPLIQRALEKAATLHDGQYRKNLKIPYIIHPVAVMILVSEHTDDEAVLAAALLHDTIEDTVYTPGELELDFGARVKGFVLDVTEDKSLPWRERKDRYLAHLVEDAPKESVLISCCDKLHNMCSIIEQFGVSNAEQSAWQAFEGKPEGYIWYWGEMNLIVKQRLGGLLAEEFSRVYAQTNIALTGKG